MIGFCRLCQARLFDDFVDMKRVVDRFQANEEIYPPLSWAQVTQLLLDFYLLSLPVALVDRMSISNAGAFQVWPLIGCFLITLFFQGLMRYVVCFAY